MKSAVLLLLLFQFSSIYCVQVIKDVVYLPTAEDSETQQTSVKKSTASATSAIPRAWITGDIIKKGVRAITVCTWVKSLGQSGTGTIFAYVSKKERVEFGLVGITKETSKDSETPHDLFVVVKGKKSAPIDLGLNDVRWHHVCATWSSRYGVSKVFKDGLLVFQGRQMKRRHMIAGGGRYYIGGGTFKFADEQVINASDISEHSIRVSTRFGTFRKKRNVVSTETKRMVGQFTDFYVWGKVLTKAQVKLMANCTTNRRIQFNEEVKINTRPANIFGPNRRKSRSIYTWAGRNVLYAWSVDTISLQRPATMKLSGNVCGYPISVECESNRMLLSMKQEISTWYNVQEYEIHLADHGCIAKQRGDFLVFHISTLESCGTKREVINKEIHYTNYITNSPKAGDIYVGQLFRTKVLCKFPVDIPASVSPVIPGRGPEAMGKTLVTNPVTGESDMEGVFALSVDNQFSHPLRQGGTLDSGKTFWGGIIVQGIYTNNPNKDVKVVVDECWVENEQQRTPLLNQQGCNGTGRIIGNGQRPDVRIEFSSSDITQNTPTYIGCQFHPCVGDNCAPNCGAVTLNRTIEGPLRRQRDVEDEGYEIKIGPITAKEEENGKDDHPTDEFLLAVILPAAVVFVSLILTVVGLVYCCSKRTQQTHRITKRQWSSDRGSTKSRHPIRAESFTFCRPGYSSYNIYPRSFHEAVRAKFQSNKMKDVTEENEQNTNTMISTVN